MTSSSSSSDSLFSTQQHQQSKIHSSSSSSLQSRDKSTPLFPPMTDFCMDKSKSLLPKHDPSLLTIKTTAGLDLQQTKHAYLESLEKKLQIPPSASNNKRPNNKEADLLSALHELTTTEAIDQGGSRYNTNNSHYESNFTMASHYEDLDCLIVHNNNNNNNNKESPDAACSSSSGGGVIISRKSIEAVMGGCCDGSSNNNRDDDDNNGSSSEEEEGGGGASSEEEEEEKGEGLCDYEAFVDAEEGGDELEA